MKKIYNKILVIICLVAVFITGVFAMPSSAFAVSDLKIEAGSAMIYLDLDTTGEVLYQRNEDISIDLASTTKLVTCAVALDFLSDLDVKDVTFKEKTLTPRDLLYLLLLPSDNDAAVKLAEYVCEKANLEFIDFIELMNDKARDFGCTSAEFNNPSGLYNENLASVRDLIFIGKGALAIELIREIAGTSEFTLSNGEIVKNGNLLLTGGTETWSNGTVVSIEKNENIVSGKTGTFKYTHANIVVLANIFGLDCYIAILDSTLDRRYTDVNTLIEYAKTVINPHTEFLEGDTFEPGKVWGGKTNLVIGKAKADGLINMPKELSLSLVTTTVKYNEKLQAPINEGDVIGTIEISIADEGVVKSVELISSETIEKGWFLSKFRITNKQTVIAGVIVLIILLLFFTLLIIRARNIRRRKKRKQELIRQEALKRLENERYKERRDWKYR